MKYWRSLSELEQTPEFMEFVHREFPQNASELTNDFSRRRWMQLMGASFALAGVAGCRWEDEKILTYNDRPEGRIPGIPQKYATTIERAGVAIGAVATAYDGRPIKLDVNVAHPQGYRGSDGYLQAAILDLYDPDRIPRNAEGKLHRIYDPANVATLKQKVGIKREARTWADFWATFDKLKEISDLKGAGLAFLADASSSPTRTRLKTELLAKFNKAKWYEYEAVSRDNERYGLKQAFGKELRPVYDLSKAKVIVNLDADLLGMNPDALRNIRDYAGGRVPEKSAMNRVYSVESQYTSTGMNADHRLAIPSSKLPTFLRELILQVGDELKGIAEPPKSLTSAVAMLDTDASKSATEPVEHGHTDKDSATAAPKVKADLGAELLYVIAKDLVAYKGAGIVAVGPQHSSALHAAVAYLNEMLENQGQTVSYLEELDSGRPAHIDALDECYKQCAKGEITTLVIIGGNPAYNSPVDYLFSELPAKVGNIIHLGEHDDETGLLSTWHLPRAHDLEAWGDGLSYRGFYSVRQPLINALHYGLSDIQFLAGILGQREISGQDLVRDTAKSIHEGTMSDRKWKKLIHDGFAEASILKSFTGKSVGELAGQVDEWVRKPSNWQEDSYELVLTPSETTLDGRFANNGWLQETPGALTKLTWDNCLLVSPRTAKELGVKQGMLVEITVRKESVSLPVYIMPGQAYRSLGVALGYGRTAAGHVGGSEIDGVETVGANTYKLRISSTPHFSIIEKSAINPTVKQYTMATTSDHWAIDEQAITEITRRSVELIREGTLDEFNHHQDFAAHRVHVPELLSLFKERPYDQGYQWGMSIDLSRCVGCNACLVACQSENNVPVVGKDQVSRHREMSWLRLDRYFTGSDPENAPVSIQPMACHHCENAPCEQVCPVAATVHSEEGLNDMAYNRCIGTRYCGNNCPYKVRRFNYLSYIKPMQQPEFQLVQLQLNPEVTVRSRGVMEKCSYCVQRIQNTKIKVKNEKRELIDGELQTACQEACPADAIVFGDINNKNTQVYKNQAENPRTYALLAELNVKPRTTYMAKIRNPHPLLKAGYFLQEHAAHGAHHGDGHDDAAKHGEGAHHDDKGHGTKDHHDAAHPQDKSQSKPNSAAGDTHQTPAPEVLTPAEKK